MKHFLLSDPLVPGCSNGLEAKRLKAKWNCSEMNDVHACMHVWLRVRWQCYSLDGVFAHLEQWSHFHSWVKYCVSSARIVAAGCNLNLNSSWNRFTFRKVLPRCLCPGWKIATTKSLKHLKTSIIGFMSVCRVWLWSNQNKKNCQSTKDFTIV